MTISKRLRNPCLLAELFVITNLGALAADIFLAHSVNDFAHAAEWIPVFFSMVAPPVLALSLWRGAGTRFYRLAGLITGSIAVTIGIAGMLLHLRSSFFIDQALHNLVYSAPFVAPLAYAGLGLLLILNRTTDPESSEWARWVLVLAAGGFLGNFILGLADHAQNGFFFASEWIPVFAAALAFGFLAVAMVGTARRSFLVTTGWVMGAQVIVGLLGFVFHLSADLKGPSESLRDRFLYGAPVFAPLLFPTLAMLAGLGLWALHRVETANRARDVR